LTAKHLSKLLNEVLTNTTYRDNARQLQKAITEAKGLSMAADLIDESLGVTEQAAKGIDGGDWKVRDR
jgi:UDP:flavonoid glycosyltransferase YjiC (YdhE family)